MVNKDNTKEYMISKLESEDRENIKANKKKKKYVRSKEEKRDAWTALAILASVLLIALLLSLLKNDAVDITRYMGHMSKEKKEAIKNAQDVGMCVGTGCIIVIIIWFTKRKKKDKLSEDRLQKIVKEQDRLREAKLRVEAARMNVDEADENVRGIPRKHTHEGLGNDTGRDYDRRYNEGLKDDMDMEERKAYMERRQREYKYYMENGEEDSADLSLISSGDEAENFNNNKKVIIFIAAGVVLITLAATIIMAIV